MNYDTIATVRLADFVICILQAQGETLKRLAALFGEEAIVELLEMVDEAPRPEPEPPISVVRDAWTSPPTEPPSGSAYAEIESAVRELGLPPQLEFHLWAYPHYRAFIESPLELNSRIRGHESEVGHALVEEAVAQATAWIRRLPIAPMIAPQAERVAQVPWLRFRSEVLKKLGKRPLESVD